MWVETFRALEQQQQMLVSRLLRDELPLHVSGVRLSSSAVERASAALASRLPLYLDKGDRRRLVFLLPNSTQSLGRFIAVSLLLADFVHRAGVGVDTDEVGALLTGDVVLVTQQIQECVRLLRGVSLRFRSESLPLSQFWPIQVMSKYSRGRGDQPRVFVANPGWAREIDVRRPFGSVVLDVSHPRTADHIAQILATPSIANAAVQIVVIPPWEAERVNNLHGADRSACLSWAWDPAAACAVREVCDHETALTPAASERHFWICDDETSNELLTESHRHLVDAMGHSSGRVPGRLLEAWSVYHRLRQLAVPLLDLEERRQRAYGTVTIGERLRVLESDEAGGVSSTHLPMIIGPLRDLYERFLQLTEPDKFYSLAACVEDLLTETCVDSLRIVAPTKAEASILTNVLGDLVDGWRDSLQHGRVSICTAREEPRLVAEGRIQCSLLLGFRTSSTRYLDVYPAVPIHVVGYQYEAEVDEAIQTRAHTYVERLQDDVPRTQVLTALHLPMQSRARTTDSSHAEKAPRTPRARTRYRTEQSSGGPRARRLQPDSLIESIDLASLAGMTWTDELVVPRHSDGSAPRDLASVGLIEVIDAEGNHTRHPESRLIDVYYPATDVKERIPARQLQPGMLMVVLVDGPYDDLFLRMIEVIDETRDVRMSMALDLWHRAKEAAILKHGGSRRRLFDSLARKGLSVDYPAVVGWYAAGEDEILAPLDQADYRLLAEHSGLYTDGAVVDATFAVIRAERTARRSCGRALKRFLAQIAAGQNYDAALETANAIGTPLEQLAAAVSLREVQDVLRVGTLIDLAT